MDLTPAQIRALRIREARAREPAPSYQQIAAELNCSIGTVANVLTGRTFKLLPGICTIPAPHTCRVDGPCNGFPRA